MIKSVPLKIFYFLLLAVLILYYFAAPSKIDKSAMTYLLSIAFFIIILFITKKEPIKNLKKQYFKHSTIFLIGYIIVFFQFPVDFILNNVSKSAFIWYDQSVVTKGITLSVIGLICFCLGYLFYQKAKNEKLIDKNEKVANVHALDILSMISLIVYFFTVNPLYLTGQYGKVGLGGIAFIAIVIFKGLIFASIIQRCINMVLTNDIPKTFNRFIINIGWFPVILIIIYLLSVLISGDRGPIIFYSLLIIGGYFFVTKKKWPLKYVILCFFCGAVLISFLGEVRSLSSNMDFSEKVQSSFSNEQNQNISISPHTQELAGSIITLHAALSHVPSNYDFFYGRFQFRRLGDGIPLFSIFYPLIFEDNTSRLSSSAEFITWIIQGNDKTYGNGTSTIADFYLDFGIVGVIVGMFFFGYLIRFSEVTLFDMNYPSLFALIVSLVYLTNTIYIARSGVLIGIGNIIGIYLILFFNRKMQKNNSSQKRIIIQ